jgi:hypothetical protein
MDLIIAFVLGAGSVVAGKRGTRLLKAALGWTARRTGYISKQASKAIDAARCTARDEFARGKDSDDPIVIDLVNDPARDRPSSDGAHDGSPANGASNSAAGLVP